jgi:16S rRNA (adenine1518-N6/adenine1519-N6)-dimethyltransferase
MFPKSTATGRSGIRALMERYDVKPTRSLGQNFLTDTNIIRKIAELSELGPGEVVCEIGPGLGALTAELAARADRIVAIEKDARIIPALKEALEHIGQPTLAPRVDIVHADFLRYDLDELPARYKLTGNLPYNITTPAIMKAIEAKNQPSLIVFMMQKEVARRICSPPGSKEYGAVSVAVQYRCDAKYAMDVSREVFIPKPKVDSAVIVMRPESGLRGTPIDETLFFSVVRSGFSQRRKMLRNSLSSLVPDADALATAFDIAGVDSAARAETLSVEQFIALADAIHGCANL